MITRLQEVSQRALLGVFPLSCTYIAFSLVTSILMSRVLLSSFPQINFFFLLHGFGFVVVSEISPQSILITGGNRSSRGGTDGQTGAAWKISVGRSLVV